jgi:hypothetical protein
MSASLTWLIRPLALMTLIKNLGRNRHDITKKEKKEREEKVI